VPAAVGEAYLGSQLIGSSPLPPDPYIRPADWVALPAVALGQKKVHVLVAVWDHDSNFVAISAAAAYTVDWGDGTTPENFATGVQANHKYDYSSVSNLSSRGYRQAVMTITPQGAGSLTTVDLQRKHTQAGLPTDLNWRQPWLDVVMVGSQISAVWAGAGGSKFSSLLERFEFVGPSSITTNGQGFFTNCVSLQEVVGTAWTATCLDFSSFFSGCSSLRTIPLLDTHSATYFGSMFASCISLQAVPAINTSAGTVFTSMFNGCRSLQSAPAIDLSRGTTFTTMFNSCSQLETVPAYDMRLGTSFANMFSGCAKLREVPLIDTRAGTNFTSMFGTCLALSSVAAFDTSQSTNFSSMFSNCSNLRVAPSLNTSKGTNFTSMFSGCSILQVVPLLDTHLGTDFTGMFNNCTILGAIPNLNVSAGLTFTNMFQNCVNLRVIPTLDFNAATTVPLSAFNGTSMLARSQAMGTKITISYASACLGPVALDEIYANLASAAGQTITVTGNWGTTGDNPAVATGKGWTVTGS
jgi:hypothetical protein